MQHSGLLRHTHFNPRSRVGSDRKAFFGIAIGFYFNPRSRVGSDTELEQKAGIKTISIHAPVWGATQIVREYDSSIQFQSTLPCGERLSCEIRTCPVKQFQSTLPCGERQWSMSYRPRRSAHFNPRSRVGSDFSSHGLKRPEKKFQSTLPCGERRKPVPRVSRYKLFQSTLPCGERLSK